MLPHERSLVSRYKDRPFALLGVNADHQRETLQRLQKEGVVTWRNWYDGAETAIFGDWGVQSLPRVYLIDHEGVIRAVAHGRPDEGDLERRIEQLLDQAEKARASS